MSQLQQSSRPPASHPGNPAERLAQADRVITRERKQRRSPVKALQTRSPQLLLSHS